MNAKKASLASNTNPELELEIENVIETTESALANDEKALRPKDLPALVRAASQGEADFISVGFGSAVAINRVLAVVAPDSAPIRRLLHEARDKGLLIDATFGRKTKAVLILDSGHVLSAALQPETIIGRVRNR
jgi:regulator of extracellular matrix RemA (YlzA/DUF370 family)